jgi:hypothetical protein
VQTFLSGFEECGAVKGNSVDVFFAGQGFAVDVVVVVVAVAAVLSVTWNRFDESVTALIYERNLIWSNLNLKL